MHDGNVKLCSYSRCTNHTQRGGGGVEKAWCVCEKILCSHDGRINHVVKGLVYIRHGVSVKKNQGVNGGVCKRHSAFAKKIVCTCGGCNALVVQGGLLHSHSMCIKIEMHNQLVNERRANVLQSPSRLLSSTAPFFRGDDEICAWIYKSCCVARLINIFYLHRNISKQSPNIMILVDLSDIDVSLVTFA